MTSPQRRRGAEISAEKTGGDGEQWGVRGVRFDAETRRRGERRGERERVGVRDSRVGWGGARRQRRKTRPSFARIGKLKPAPPRDGQAGGQAGGLSYLFFQLTMSASIPSPPGWPSLPRLTISGSSAWCSPGKR